MADTTTARLALVKPEVGSSADTWGTKLNADLDVVDLAIQYGTVAKTLAAANVTLTDVEAASSIILLSGTLTASVSVSIPLTYVRSYTVRNSTTGAFTVTVKTPAGTGVLIPQGTTAIVFSDGTNISLGSLDINSQTSKATPVDADAIPLMDSAAGNILKKLTWVNLKATFLATVNTWTGAQTFTSTVDLSGAVLQGATPLVFEGATADAFETSVAVTDPTADRTQTLPDATGTFVLDTTNPSKIQPIAASVAANALTVTLNATTLDFRSATLTSGTVNTRNVASPISVVVSSGSTLGTVSAVQNRLAVLAIDNAGTVELAVVNLGGGNDLSETGVISTTAEGGAGAADSASVIYSTAARTNVPYRVVGYVESTQTTAGTWATAPSTIQGAGGNAVTAMSSIGYGQTWQDVTGSRALGTTYTNTTGRPIMVAVSANSSGGTFSMSTTVAGLGIAAMSQEANFNASSTFIVPPGNTYSVDVSAAPKVLSSWYELR